MAASQRAPVIVLTYAHSGAERLHRLLSGYAGLSCTLGTGVLPLCHMAATTWRQLENRDGSLSSLALASIRTMAGSMITAILAATGGSRWCETAHASARAAETFLELYPAAQFLCLHRKCQDVIYAGVQANPWGLADSPFEPFTAAYPGSSIAAIAAYWTASTEPLLRFEQAHPQACRRVRYEDLTADPEQVTTEISAYLNVDQGSTAATRWLPEDTPPPNAEAEENDNNQQIPADQIPSAIRAEVSALLTRIGYPPLHVSPRTVPRTLS